jgi:hypothetical protein
MRIVEILPMSDEAVNEALYSGFHDFEDALQCFASLHSKQVDAILTRKVKDYKKCKLGALTPEEFLKQNK